MSRRLHLGDFHPQLESKFLDRLRATLEGGDARPLLVVVPNRLLGVHLRRRAAQLGCATLGLRPRALEDLIREWAEPLVRERRLRELPDWALSPLLAEVMLAPATEGRRSEGFHRALAGTLRDLRDAGVTSSGLTRALARGRRSGGGGRTTAEAEADLGEAARERVARAASALAALERALDRRRLVDGARCSALAMESLALGACAARRIWIYGFYELVARQQAVVETLLGRADRETEFEVFFPWPGEPDGAVAEYARPLRRWFEERGFVPEAQVPEAALETAALDDLGSARRAFARRAEVIQVAAEPEPFAGDGGLWAVRAASAPLEALDVLRLAETARPGESVGILPRHDEILQELTLAARRSNRRLHRLPAESLRRGPLGRAVLALLDLATERQGEAQREGALPRGGVEELLVSGGVAPERFPVESRPELWTQAMRRRGLVGGLAAWNRFLERHGPQARLFDVAQDDEERLPELQRELPAIALFVTELLDDLRALGQDKKRWSERSRRFVDFVERWLVPGDDRQALVERTLRLADLDGVLAPSWRHFRVALEQALDQSLAGGTHFGDGPTIAALSSVRGVTFDVLLLPRMVEKGFPRVGREDPLLTDQDRERLAQRLGADLAPGALSPKRSRVRAEEAFLFQLALGMARRSVVLSWPTRGEEGGIVVPSSFLLDLVRPAAGREATYEDLRSSILLPTAPSGDLARPILGSEWDLRCLEEVTARRREAGHLRAWLAVHPRLGPSLTADRARRRGEITGLGDGLTEYDGLVGADLVAAWWARSAAGSGGARSHSPSALEDYAGCGFRFLWKRVLRTHGEPPPERTLDLEPREIGSLVHEVLRELFHALSRERLLPLSATALGPARARLAPILDRLVAAQPGRIGEGPVALWQARRRRILEDLEEFLEREVASAEKWRPIDLEVTFGDPEPLVVEIGGERLAVRGRIDRIDERPGAVRIVDYKTGRLGEDSEQPGSVAGGQRLQLPLYRLALERWRGERRPLHGALLGVTSKSDFRRVEWSPAHFEQAAEPLGRAIHGIVSGIDAGEFFQVERDRFCDTVCEWSTVCGPGRRRVIAAKRDDPRVVAADSWRSDRAGRAGEDES